MNLVWCEWGEDHVLLNEDTQRNEAWIKPHKNGWMVQMWGMQRRKADWIDLVVVPDLDAAKMIARLNAESSDG